MAYSEKHELRDGRVLIYRKDNSPFYQVRLSIIDRPGYIVRSTKRKRLPEAYDYAEKLYDDLSHKARNGIEIFPHTFETLWKRWYAFHAKLLSVHRLRYITGTYDRYFSHFFADLPIEQLTQAKVSDYWHWRINYWSSDHGQLKIETAQKTRTTGKRPYKQKLGNVAKIPSQKTLQMEQSVLRQILRWSHSHGLINRLPEIKVPKLAGKSTNSRRPAFTLDEWQTLYRHMRDWSSVPTRNDMKGKGPNSHHIWHRRLFRRYVLFMGVSGLRPNEARQLKWRDVHLKTDNEGNEYILLKISENTKTGARDCVPLEPAKSYLEDIRSFSLHTEPDDLIFCDKEGRAIENFGKTFQALLDDIGIRKDGYGKSRTIYSLRHTYATFVLLRGHGDVELLAQNMGTSPQQIFNHYRHITVQQKSKELSGRKTCKFEYEGFIFLN